MKEQTSLILLRFFLITHRSKFHKSIANATNRGVEFCEIDLLTTRNSGTRTDNSWRSILLPELLKSGSNFWWRRIGRCCAQLPDHASSEIAWNCNNFEAGRGFQLLRKDAIAIADTTYRVARNQPNTKILVSERCFNRRCDRRKL